MAYKMDLVSTIPSRIGTFTGVILSIACVSVFATVSLSIVHFRAFDLSIKLAGTIPIARNRPNRGIYDRVATVAEDLEVVLAAEHF